MANPIILMPLADSSEAERILDAFEEQTGWSGERRDDGRRVYELEGEAHHHKMVHVLTAIDARWTDHIGLKDPG